MMFVDIPVQARVFVDANTFVFHFSRHPILAAPCSQLIDRFVRKELNGFTTADVLSDTAHRLMCLEAITVLGWKGTGISSRLRKHAHEIQKLTGFQQAIQEIPRLGVQVTSITSDLVQAATGISRQYGLLSGDALIVVVMQANGLTHLASHDADFDRVPGITRYAPA